MSKARWEYGPEEGGLQDRWTPVAARLVHRITRGKRYRRWKLVDLCFIQQGPFTQASVMLEHPRIPKKIFDGIGFTKRSPRDPYSEVVGKTVALARAIRDALDIPIPKG